MWQFALDLIVSSVTAAFSWFGSILDAAPGAWDAIFTVFVILAVSRFLLGPLLGVVFSVGSDKANKNYSRKSSKEE